MTPKIRAYGGVALAALLFGAAFPLSKRLIADVKPIGLAALIYLASGVALGGLALLRGRPREASIARADLPWLAGVVLAGGVLGPVLLFLGLDRSSAHVAALLSSTETVFTAVLAILFFGDFLNRKEWLGTATICGGATLVALAAARESGPGRWQGPLLLVGSGLAWGVDNNLTQRLSGRDPLQVAAVKGIVAGLVNLGLAAAVEGLPPLTARIVVSATLVGTFCYGLSLALFIVGLRHLGAARSSALFATAPGMALVLSWTLLGEIPGRLTVLGALLMIPGAWLLIRTGHSHRHVHEPLEHDHRHVHDEHHRHGHRGDEGPEPHSHPHRHDRLEHEHDHVADLHHRHAHS